MKKERYDKIFILFFVLLALATVIFIIQLVSAGIKGSPYDVSVFNQFPADRYMDFFNIVCWAKAPVPYDAAPYVNQPPLVYLLVRCFAFGEIESAAVYRESTPGHLALAVYSLLFYIPAFFLLRSFIRQKGGSWKIYLPLYVLLIFSAPVAFCLQRGNHVFFALLTSAYFFIYYNSERRWRRETAYFALAFAIAVKITPIVFSLFLLKKGRIPDLIKTAVYTVILVFVPFGLIGGGYLHNIKQYIMNTGRFYGSAAHSNSVCWNISLTNTFYTFYMLFTGAEVKNIPMAFRIIVGIFPYLIIGLSVVLFFVHDVFWKKLASLTVGVVLLYPSPCYVYYLLFIIIPVSAFLYEPKKNKSDYAYLGLFLILLFSVQFGYLIPPEEHGLDYGLTMSNFIQSLSLIVIFILLAIEGIKKIRLLQIKEKEKGNGMESEVEPV